MSENRVRSGLFSNLRGDLLGGITAGIVALPLALAFGVASGIPNGAAAGIYGAIALGIVAALFGGTPAQISGPTGPMTVVVAGLAVALQDHPGAIFLVVILAGALQVFLGAVRVGTVIRYIPYPVVSGFMSGIGVIIVVLHIPVVCGFPSISSPLEAVTEIPTYVAGISWTPFLLALGTIALVYIAPLITRAIPSSLVALVTMTLVTVASGVEVASISSIPSGLPVPSLAAWDWSVMWLVIPGAIALALLASVDSLLTALVADRITSTQHDSNRELVGQGLGNMLAGLVGGLPGAGATMRTVVNVRSGGRGRLSGVAHGLLLLGVLVGLAPVAERIPLPVLAGLLITVGIGILDYRGLGDALRAPKTDTLVMLVVLALTVAVDLMVAVAAGVVLSSLVFVKRVGDRHPTTPSDGSRAMPVGMPGVRALRATPSLFFGNAELLRRALDDVTDGTLILSLEAVEYIDQSAAYALADAIEDLRKRDVRVLLAGPKPAAAAMLARLSIMPGMIPKDDVYTTLAQALDVVQARADRVLPAGPKIKLRGVVGDGHIPRQHLDESIPERRQWLSHIRQQSHVPKTAFVHPDATVIGRVVMGDHVHVAAGSSVRADEGSPFYIGESSNVQDGVVIHALENRRVRVHGEEWAVYVGRNVSMAHGALVHGPCYVGDGTFIGFQAVVHDSIVGAGCWIGIGAVVVGVELPEGRLVPHGMIVDTADKVAALGSATDGQREFAEDVVHVNRGLVAAYREQRRVPDVPERAPVPTTGTAGWIPATPRRDNF
jgi:SulP family sulfate permease